jgi:hypothetical protein
MECHAFWICHGENILMGCIKGDKCDEIEGFYVLKVINFTKEKGLKKLGCIIEVKNMVHYFLREISN